MKQRVLLVIFSFLFSCLHAGAQSALELKKPEPAFVEKVETDYFGMKISDPYRWMEQGLQDKSFEKYLRSQNDYTHLLLSAIGPAREKLLARIKELDTAVPIVRYWQKVGERIFYIETATDTMNTSLMLKDEFGKSRCLLDPRKLAKQSKNITIDYFAPSFDGKHLVVGTSLGGSEDSIISIVDVESGELLPERISRTQYGFPSWRADSKSFYYSRLQELPAGSPSSAIYENQRVYLHMLRENPDKDPLIFGSGVNAGLDVPKAGFGGVAGEVNCPYVIAFHSAGTIDAQTIYLAKQDKAISTEAGWQKIVSKEDKLASQAASNLAIYGSTAFMLLEKDAPNRKLLALNLKAPDLATAKLLKPESDRVLLGVYCASDALYLTSKKGVNYFLQRLAYEDGSGAGSESTPGSAGGSPASPLPVPKFEDIILPFAGAISNCDASPRSAGLLFRLESWTEPGQSFFYDPDKKQVINTGLVKKHTADFSAVEAREVTIRSADGTMVPVSIICRKDIVLDGSHPTIEVGYGAYGISLEPNFDPTTLSWIEKSGVIAFVHARGGGELGQAWHSAGQKASKQHTIDDMIAAAQYLIDMKYTSSKSLAIKGTSAGGIACGGAITQRPDLFAVAIDNVGMTDMLRFQNTQGGAANIPEFGDVTKEDDCSYLYAMSAYHHIKDNAHYPAVMGITGVNDPRVPSWIIAKMIARLQAASASNKPVLLRVDFDAGHGLGSSRSQRQRQMADERSFMLWQFGDPAFQIDDEFER